MQQAKRKQGMLLTILTLALPTMIEQAMQTAVQYVDTAMVGTLGTKAVAAVGATTTFNWLVGSSIAALSVGFLSFIARALGAGEKELARRASAQALFVTLIVGGFFTALTLTCAPLIVRLMQVESAIEESATRYFLILYAPMLFRAATIVFSTLLRAAGDTKTPMITAFFTNLSNVVLNLFFIYPTREVSLFGRTVTLCGLDLGVEGAALASAASFVLGAVLISAALFRHPILSPLHTRIRPDKEILAPCLKVALPNLFQRFFTSLGYVVFASLINSLGELSTAATTVANTVESAFYIPAFGMQTAAATLMGNAHGARDREKMRKLPRTFLPLECALMLVSGTLLFLFAPQLVALFSESEDVRILSVTILRMVALSEPFYGVPIILEGMMQGVGETRLPFLYNILGMWGVRIVGTIICIRVFSLGLIAAWGCMIAHNLLLFVLFPCGFYKRRERFLQPRELI